MQLFPKIPLRAPHRITRMQIITGNYRVTHYRHITDIYMAFTIKNVCCYRRFTDKAGLFTQTTAGNENIPAYQLRGNEIFHL